MKQFRLLFFIITICLSNVAQAQNIAIPPGLDKYIDTVLNTFEVPGVSVAIVYKGKVVFTKGYGIKKLGDAAAVDEHTLFPIASNTKAFTTTALAILEEDGKLKWDDPVTKYLPWFKMSDPWVTGEITVGDLLVHHSGIPAYAGDLLIFPPSTYSRREIIAKVKSIPLVHSFRTTYAYDNILYLTAGEVIKAASGMEWEDFVKTRILDKAGMTETLDRFTSIKSQPNIAYGHLRLKGKVKLAGEVFEQAVGDAGDPAGGIACNAVDMAKWLITQLDSGLAPNNTRLFKPASTNKLWKIVTPMPIGTAPPELAPSQMDFWGYAAGLRAYNYGKYKVIGHGGKLDGFVSQIAMVPKLNLGIAVLTHQESGSAYWSIIYHILDYYMQNPSFNWIAGFKKDMDSSLVKAKADYQKAIIPHTSSITHSLPLEKYAGIYKDDFYGDVTVTSDSSHLTLRFNQTPQLVADLQPFQYESFTTTFHNPDLKADGYASFSISPDGTVEQLKLKITDPGCDLNFDDLLFKRLKQ